MDTSRKQITYVIHCVIILALMFGFKFVPAPAPMTPLGMSIMGILLGMIYGWMVAGLIWPSLLGIVAIMVNGLMKPGAALAASFGTPTVWLIFFVLVVSTMVDKSGLPKKIAMALATNQRYFGKPWLFSFIILFVTWLLSALAHVVAAIVICWGIVHQISEKLGYKKQDPYSAYMVLGVVVAGMLGTAALPFKPLPYAIMTIYTTTFGYEIGFGPYLAASLTLSIIVLVVFCLAGKFILRIDASKLKNLTTDAFDPEDFDHSLSKDQKINLFVLITMIVLLLLPNILPANTPFFGFFRKIGVAGTMMVVTGVLVMIKVDGKSLLPFNQMVQGVQWGVVFLIASLMPFAKLIAMEEAGIQAWMFQLLLPIFQGQSLIIYLLLLTTIAVILTNYLNNGVVGALLIIATTPITLAMGFNPSAIALVVILAIHIALVSPAGAVWSAMLFDNHGWISTKQIYKYSIPNMLIIILILVFIEYPLAAAVLG